VKARQQPLMMLSSKKTLRPNTLQTHYNKRYHMNISTSAVAILERTAVVGTFPVTKSSFSISETCATHNNHYCQCPSSRGSVIIDEVCVCCGKPFCNLCAIHCGCESHTSRCPSCHPESSLKNMLSGNQKLRERPVPQVLLCQQLTCVLPHQA
jgi:hypothetical protein